MISALIRGFNGLVKVTSWISRISQFGPDVIQEIAYGNGIFVAVGGNGKISTSPDGITWTLREKINTTIRTIIYGNGLFISGGAKIYTAQWPAT